MVLRQTRTTASRACAVSRRPHRRHFSREPELGVIPSTGTVGDSFDNVMAEAVNNLYKVDTRPYLDGSRPSFRKDTVLDTWKKAVEDSPDGVVRDPNPPYEVIDWKLGDRRANVWEMGHLPDQRYRDALERYRNGDYTPEEFRNWYNNPDHYRPETPKNNRSNRYSDG